MARERGQVAHSRELTGAVGLLAAAAALSVWGDGLAAALLAAVRDPLSGPMPVSADAADVVSRLRQIAFGVALPLTYILGAAAAAALAAHQGQVLGLWTPGLLAPDLTRLWAPGNGPGFAARSGRGVWALAKSVVVVAVAVWVVRSGWASFERLGGLDTPALARASGQAVRHLTLTLAVATLGLGLVDFALQHSRFEAMMRMTPDEQREELHSLEGDPALRARRRRVARSWRNDPSELLTGATLILNGRSGLTVILGGGPPPRPLTVRSIVSGSQGDPLRRAAEAAKIPQVDAPELARRLAQRKPPSLPPTPELTAEIAAAWPV